MKGLGDLPNARSFDRCGIGASCPACLIPRQSQESKYLFQLVFWIFDEIFIGDVDNVLGKYPLPVRHQPAVLTVVVTDIHEIQRVGHAGVEV